MKGGYNGGDKSIGDILSGGDKKTNDRPALGLRVTYLHQDDDLLLFTWHDLLFVVVTKSFILYLQSSL